MESRVRFLWWHSTGYHRTESVKWKKNNFRHIMITPKNWISVGKRVSSIYSSTFFRRMLIRCEVWFAVPGYWSLQCLWSFWLYHVQVSSLSLFLANGSVLIISFLFSEPTLQWLSDTLETFLVSQQTTLWCPSAMSKCGKWCLFF